MAMAMAMAMAKEEETVDWSQLPNTALDVIMDCLNTTHSISDYFTFGTICVSWRSAYNLHNNPPLLPMLMVPPSFSTLLNRYRSDADDYILTRKKKSKKDLKLRRFYNISNEKVDDRLKVRMPQNRHCRGGGSSHAYGWLITIDGNKSFTKTERSKRNKSCFSIRLFNPFLSSSIGGDEVANIVLLPPLIKRSNVSDYSDLWKAVLSADPISNPTDYMVMAIYSASKVLAFYKPGDKSWTTIKSPNIEDYNDGGFVDLIYYQGKFFILHCAGTIVVCDDLAGGGGGGVAARVLLRPPKTKNTGMRKYVVESSQGNLLQVHRELIIDPKKKTHSTIGFKVFKLLLLDDDHHSTKVHEIGEEEKYRWVRVKSLRGDAIFLGNNASFSISTIDNPRCKSNCIYYTDNSDFCVKDAQFGSHDMGVFNLVEGIFNRYFPTDPKDTSAVLILPNPIWIQPTKQREKKQIAFKVY